MDIPQAIAAVLQRQDLSTEQMQAVMHQIMTGGATPAQIGGFLVGLRMKGETVTEIAAAATVMRDLATPVRPQATGLVDTCGTGGDGSGLFNVSTASAIVVAAAGGKVAKHGNRSISSKSGSADVLETAGVKLDLSPEQVAACIDQVGVGFMFAPAHHSAMKHAIGPRKEMAVRTIFNVLGPLTNPAGAKRQVLGVFAPEWVEPLARVLVELGAEHALVVHGDSGLDEFSLTGSNQVAEVQGGQVRCYQVDATGLGLSNAPLAPLRVADAAQSLALIQAVFNGQDTGPATDMIALNAGAALYVAGLADSHQAGVQLAQTVITDGRAAATLKALSDFSHAC